MKIYVDFDDVICETAKYFTYIAKELFDIEVPYKEVQFFNLKKSFDLNDEQYDELMRAGHIPENLLAYEETQDASEIINKWVNNGHEVFVITGRPFDSYDPSRKWLDNHGLERVPLYCVDKYGRESFNDGCTYSMTLEQLYRMSFDFAVEDSPAAYEHVLHFKQCQVAVFNRPWNVNENVPNDRFVRCENWQAIDRLLESKIMKMHVDDTFDVQEYMTKGVENIVKGALKATLSDPKESLFMMQYAAASKQASKKRAKLREEGEEIPPFLIASITSSCNLHCAGCYSRANHACSDDSPVEQLTCEEWRKVFLEAKDLGIGFILLAGGEPMLRKDVIEVAGTIPDILFPIFTNGTMIGDLYIDLFRKYRNLIPVISIEGHEETTDQRRGTGIYEVVQKAMSRMKKNKVLFGASVTVTTRNLKEVTSDGFVETLKESGTKVVFYVEYVPVTPEAIDLAPGDEERAYIKDKITYLRKRYEDILFVAFPGDEKSSGGCLAAGRGFFHINSHGGAEPCPFSPYSDINVKNTSVREALHSRLFEKLRTSGALLEEHAGGCVLFKKRELVEEFIK